MSLLGLGCKKKQKQANLSIAFSNHVDGQAIVKDQLLYTNTAGNLYSISLLKYYITNGVLVNEDGSTISLNNYDLIDEFSKNGFSTIDVNDIPNGHYTTFKFYVGIDKQRNHNGAQDGDLDPLYNMIWSWATGYIFLKHEGQYITPSGDTTIMQYHIATDAALREISLPIHLTIDGKDKKLNIAFNVNSLYNNPAVNIHTQPIMHSTSAADQPITTAVADNLQDAFTYVNESE